MLRKTRNTLLIAVGIMLTVEVGLQVRSQVRFGQSVFNVIGAETTYVRDKSTGLKLLRPNHRIEGTQAIIVTNALGLRDESIAETKPKNEYRIALVGASTVMGTYTRNNQDTLSYRLQDSLNNPPAHRSIRVINAGIAGYTLNDQRQMIDRLLSRLSVDHYLLYTGFNDLSTYCGSKKEALQRKSYALPSLRLPSWLLTTELITKNTVMLRTSRAGGNSLVDPETVDTAQFQNDITKLTATLKATGRPVLVIGNAWAFRRDMPRAQRIKLSETARYYKSCFDTDSLELLFENHNRIIERVATDNGFRYFNLQDELPGGRQYFGDSTHFSVAGTQRAAEIIAAHIENNNSLAQ